MAVHKSAGRSGVGTATVKHCLGTDLMISVKDKKTKNKQPFSKTFKSMFGFEVLLNVCM